MIDLGTVDINKLGSLKRHCGVKRSEACSLDDDDNDDNGHDADDNADDDSEDDLDDDADDNANDNAENDNDD